MISMVYIKFNNKNNSGMVVTPREYLFQGLREDYFGVLETFYLYGQRLHVLCSHCI